MIDQLEMMRVLEKFRDDAVVMPVFQTVGPWAQVSRNPKRDVPIGTFDFPFAMGKASSFALGFALAQPSVKVILFDGDGSLLMSLGSVVTVANKAPKNLYHFVMDNGVYATTGGQDVPGRDAVSYEAMARAAGYRATYEFDDLEEFATSIAQILNQEGPVLISIKAIPDIRDTGELPPADQVSGSVPQVIVNLLEEFGRS